MRRGLSLSCLYTKYKETISQNQPGVKVQRQTPALVLYNDDKIHKTAYLKLTIEYVLLSD